MNRINRIVASSVACCAAFAQAVFAGNAYTPDPVIEDSGSDAGILLLIAVGALILIRAAANPAPPPQTEVPTDPAE